MTRDPIIATILSLMTLSAAAFAGPAPGAQHEAYLLDMSEPENAGEALMGVTLQGLVNRDVPRLFLRSHFWVNPASDDFWVRYLTEKKAFHFTKLHSLGEAVARLSGEGRIKGLVVYDPVRYADSCIAATIAAQRDLLPVTPEMLAYRTPMLAGAASWVEDDMSRPGLWGDWFGDRKSGPDGMTVTTSSDTEKQPRGVQRWVKLDLNQTPFLEIQVEKVSGAWGVMLNVGARDSDAPMAFPFSSGTGVFRCDLRKLIAHGEDRALVRIGVRSKGDAVTVRRLRLLAPDGSIPTVQPAVIDCFRDLKVLEDLRGRFSDEESAYAWAVQTLLPGCSKKMAFSAIPGWWNMMGADLAVARRAFLFHQNNKEIRKDYPLFDTVLRSLEPPGALLGWGHSEWLMTWRTSELGNYVLCSGAPNLSFWAKVPVDRLFSLPEPQRVKAPLERKHYVVFYSGDGDAPKTIAGVLNGDWTDPARGRVPMAWGIQPCLMELCPALLEYYAHAATPDDSFFSGPSGGGYTYPITMPNLDQFVDYSRGCMAAAGVSTLDEWDLVKLDFAKVHQRFTAPGRNAPVRCFLQAPMGMGQPAANLWLEDGTPVVIAENTTPDSSLWAVMPNDFDRKDPVSDVVRRITAVADAQEPPYFIAVYSHMSPSFCREVERRLDKERFKVIGVGDLERLSREAGELTASADRSGVGPGGSMQVDLALHNPDGRTGQPGTVTWTLPPRWTASEKSWQHDGVPLRGVLRHSLTITSSAAQTRAQARILFHDSWLPWERGLRVECYPESRTVTDCATTEGWEGGNGGKVDVADGQGQFSGTQRFSRVLRSVAIDFDRSPILEVIVPKYDGKWGVSLIDGASEVRLLNDSPVMGDLAFDLAKRTGWTGRRTVKLAIYPAMSFGTWVTLKSIALHYEQ